MKLLSLLVALLLVSACGREIPVTRMGESATKIGSLNVTPSESCEGRLAGEVFLATDGINHCSCNEDGTALCTLIAVSE